MKTNKKQLLLKLSKKKLSIFDVVTLYKLLTQVMDDDLSLIKVFIDNYYNISEMPDEFYQMFLYTIKSNKYKELFTILLKKNIYDLINFLKYDNSLSIVNDDSISSMNYFGLSYKQIKKLTEGIKNLDVCNNEIPLKVLNENNAQWRLRKRYMYYEKETNMIAIKLYLTIGFDNSIDLLSGKYGIIDYEILYYLFNNVEVKENCDKKLSVLHDFLFSNKKDFNNNLRLMLAGNFNELFNNFDYFFNFIDHFIEKLGIKLNKHKVLLLLKERYLTLSTENPEVSGDIIDDMLASYYRYDDEIDEAKIIDKNLALYNEKLKRKTKTSIPKIDIPRIGAYTFDMIPLDDVRNLVMGYRAGNCFRINGDAFILFNNFLTNPHMRLLSISTDEYKDFGMVLLMRNGNVMMAQGIETSKRVPDQILGEKLYDAVNSAVKIIMDSVNSMDDEIVASIIGLTNNNTIPYNRNYLPFIINPILENSNHFYNGVDSYQGLLSVKEGKTLHDIKLFTPSKFYSENNCHIYRRSSNDNNYFNYMEIEKILMSLRYTKFKTTPKEEMVCYYSDLSKKVEEFTVCCRDWFITVFEDGTYDGFINSDVPEVVEEYNNELDKIKKVRIKCKNY